MRKCGIECEDILRLFLHCWAEQPFNYASCDALINDMGRFHRILRQICIYADERVAYEYNSLCDWWQSVREFLLDSLCALRGLLAAFVCRNTALKYEGAIDAAVNETFEQVSQEACEWTLLITKLDDIAVLGAILKNQVKSDDAFLPPLAYASPEISLKEILNGGLGIITELVARWVAASEMDPKKLLQLQIKTDEEKKDDVQEKISQEMFCLKILHDHFPFSLQSKAVLCQLTWDYMQHWSRNLADLHFMRAGIECLKVFKPEDWSVKHGVCVMVWNAHLKVIYSCLNSLVHF